MKAILLRRLKEPSTYAGLAAIVAAIAPFVGVSYDAAQASIGVLGALAVLVRESPPPPPPAVP